ncbi:hypothetical protein [Aurantimonas endophytica]|uniref:S-layer family protein n=1 Tax=Aurantimonas endophytica TaxID=1522175 RepID=A0A7W6HC81_9HYPH|nr:hypothetical protein [Aurantimonas endophytica]MBB4002549.1 hypothetical protein [Aurantimonas endophytica]MCO6403430.1 hypothetical protein [Aurantimonas endophytica]
MASSCLAALVCMSANGLARAQDAGSAAAAPLWGAHADIVGRTAHEHSAAGVEFFVPLLQDQDSLIFIDAGINGDFDSEVYGTFGVGYRQIINPGLILGGIIAVDVTRTDDENTFGAISLGAEAIGTGAEARINVQLPFSGASQLSDETLAISQPGTLTLLGSQLVEQAANQRITVDEVPLTGVEGEVGVNLPIGFDRFDDELKAFAGAYHYDGDGVDSFTGVSGRLEYSVRDVMGDSLPGAELILSAGLTHDEEYGTNFAGEARLRIPLGVPARADGNARALSPIEERMTQRVVRTTRIHTSERTRTQTGGFAPRVVTDPLTGLPLDAIIFADGAETVGTGTLADPTTLEDAVLRAGVNGTIVAEGGNGTIDTPGVTLANGQRLVGGGVVIPVRLADGTIASFQLGQTAPVIAGVPTANVITLAAGNRLQALTITGGLSGIAGTNVGALTLQQITIAGSAGAGFSIVNTAGTNTLAITGLSVSGTGGPGIAVNGLGGGTTTVTGFSGVGVASAGGGGVLFDGVTFDADPATAGFQRVEAGNLTIGDQANPAVVVGDGLRLNQVAGDLDFASLLIANSNGAGLFIRDRGGPGGDFSFGNDSGAITTVGGTAIDIDPVALAARFGSVSSTNANGQGSGGNEGLFLDNILARDAGSPALVIDSLQISGAAGDGLVATNNAGNLVFGTTTITNVGGTGIRLANNTGSVSFADTVITNPGLDGIDIAGINGSVSFGNVDITGLGTGTGLDLTDEAGFAATRVALAFQTLDIAGTGAAGSVGIDYSGTTNNFDVTTADSSSISGVAIGIDLRNAAATGLFQYGDGSATDADGRASLITADRPLEIAGLSATTGLYNLRDVAYVGDISNLTGITVFYVDADGGNDPGLADGSAEDPGTLAQAIASGADVIALVDNQLGGQDVIDAGSLIQGAPGSLTLAGGQRVVSFLAEDLVDVGGGSGVPINLLLTGIDANIVRNPNAGSGAPRLTTTEGGSNTLVLDSSNALLGTVIDNGAGAIAVFGSGISGLTLRDSQVASISLNAAGGTGLIENVAIGQLALDGGTVALVGTNVDIGFGGAGAALSVGGGHSGNIAFDAASAITVSSGLGLRFDGSSGSYAFGGTTTLGGGANLSIVDLFGSLTFGDVTIASPAGNGIDIAGTNGAISFGDIAITGVAAGAVALDFNGAALTGAFSASSLVATGAGGTPPAGSIGIDLRGVTGGQAIRVGVSPAPDPAADTPSTLTNFATGVFVDAASNAVFTFGDGEDAVDQASRIFATTRIDATSAPTLGSYNFLDVDFLGAAPGAGFVPATIYYFSETGTGTGATQSDPGSIAGAEASGADLLVPIGLADIDAAASGGSLDLVAAQQLRGFATAGGTLDVGFTGPSTIQISASSSTITDLNNEGSPTLTTTAAQSVVNLSDGNTLSFISTTGGTSGIAGSGINNLVASNISVANTTGAGISLTGTTGNIAFGGTTSVTATGGTGVSIAATSGTVSFATLSVDNLTTPTAGGGVSISGPGSFGFTNGFDIRTSSGTGFTATGGATVTVAATAGAETVTTATGPILAWNGVTIGTGGVSFDSLTATGIVTGDAISFDDVAGGAFSSGTVGIAGTTGLGADGIQIVDSAASFDFGAVTIANAVARGIALTGANGDVTFASIDITGGAGRGVEIFGAINDIAFNGGSIGPAVTAGFPFRFVVFNQAATSTISLSNVDITGDAGSADLFNVQNSAGTINVTGGTFSQASAQDTVGISGGSATITIGANLVNTGTGSAVRIDGTSGTIVFDGTVSNSGGGRAFDIGSGTAITGGSITFNGAITDTASSGVRVQNLAAGATFAANAALTVTNAVDDALSFTNNEGALSFAGVTASTTGTARGIAISDAAGSASYQFNGQVTLDQTGSTGDAVSVTGAATHTVSFLGGLSINAATGAGFTASGPATINVAATGTRQITTTTGRIVDWNGVAIGGVDFASLTAGTVIGDAITLTGATGGTFAGGAVSIAGTTGPGADGIAVTGSSAAIGLGATTIGATEGNGIALSDNAGTVTFGGTTTLINPGVAGVAVTGTNGAIGFASLQIALQSDNTTGVDLGGANLDAGFTATGFDLTSTSPTGTTAIDLSGTTSTGTVRFGDTEVAGQSATIDGAGGNATGPTTGIQLASANIANFIFGDGESAVDQGSRIVATNRLDASAGPAGGSYNILDVDFAGAAPGPGFTPATAYYFSATGTGTGATIDDPGSIAGAQASNASLLIPIGNTQIDAAGAGGSLVLDANQQLRAFDAPGGTLDIGFTYGGLGVIQTTATAGNISDTAGDGSPELTTTSGAPVINLSDGNTLSRIRINGGAVGVASTVAINSLIADDLTISNTTGAGILLAGTVGNIAFGGTTTVTATGGPGVSLAAAGGTISFATLSVDNATTAGGGVAISGTGSFNFTNGLAIRTSTGTGFSANSGGTIRVAATAGAETIVTGSGQALSLSGVSVGAGGLNFDAVSANGPNVGIGLINVGSVDGGAINLGTVDLDNMIVGGVRIVGTLGAALNFGSLAVGLAGDAGTAFILNGVALGAAITAGDFDVTNAGARGTTIGVDLTGVTGNQIVRLGDANPGGASSSIAGVATGVVIGNTSSAQFTFGDGEASVDRGSTIEATVRIAAPGSVPAGASFNFQDLQLDEGGPGTGFGIGRIIYVDSDGAAGGGDGSGSDGANPATLADAEAAAGEGDIIVLINNGTVISAAGSGTDDTLRLLANQQVLGFANGDISIGFTAPTGIDFGTNSFSVADPITGVGVGGAATLTSDAGDDVITLGVLRNRIDGFILDGGPAGASRGIASSASSDVTISNMTIRNFNVRAIDPGVSQNLILDSVIFADNDVDLAVSGLDITLSNVTSTGATGSGGAAIQFLIADGTTTLTNVSVTGAANGAMRFETVFGTVNATNVDLSGASALAVVGGNAAFSFDADSSIINNAGVAVSLSGRTGGSFTHAGTVTSDGAGAGGIAISGATAANTVNFSGSVNLGGTTALGLSGVSINNNATVSNVTFANLDVATNGVTAFSAEFSGTINVADGSLSALGATAVVLTTITADVNFGSTISTGGVNNVAINNLIGGSVALGTGALSGATATAFQIDMSTGDVSYGGSLSKTLAGPTLSISGHSDGAIAFSGDIEATGSAGGILIQNTANTVVDFSGTVTHGASSAGILIQNSLTTTTTFSNTVTLSTGAFNAVELTGTGSTSFNGGLDITTTSGAGFVAVGGGTINVAATGTRQITTTTGRILDWNGVAIGGGNVSLGSMTASGTVLNADAINLTNVSGGSFFGGPVTVAGTSGAGSDGIEVNNSSAIVNFGSTAVTISNTAGNGVNLVGANGTVTMFNTTVNGAAGSGVRISGTSGFVFMGGSIGVTTVNGGPGLLVENTVSGTVQTTGINVRANGADAVQLSNNAGAVQMDWPGTITQLGAGDGVDISGGTGNVQIDSSIVHSGAAGAAVRIAGTSGAISFDGDEIRKTVGGVTADISDAIGTVQIGGVFGGEVIGNDGAGGILIDNSNVAFGTQVRLTTGTANAVTITNNAGRTVAFTGGLAINTTSGAGFTADSGTVNVAALGTRQITTTTGRILGLSDVAIGAAGVNFASLTSTGILGVNAVSLANVTGGGFAGGTVSVASTTGSAITVAGSSSSIGFGTTTIGQTGGDGIALTGNTGSVSFSGITTVNNPGLVGVDIEGTNSAISFADLKINLNTAGTTGLDLSGAVLDGNVTATDFDVTGTTIDTTLGVNLANTTRTGAQVVRLGDTAVNGQSSSIVGTGRGVLFSPTTDIHFVFGDGEGVIDTGSLIAVAGRAIDSTGVLLPTSGIYNFADVEFGSSVIDNLASISVYFVDQANNGAGAGTFANPGSIQGFEASTANVLVLIDRANNGTSDLIDMGTGSLDLASGRVAISFGSGDAAIDVSTLGVAGSGAPSSFTFTGIANSPIIQAPGGIDTVRPTLTTGGTANTINLPTTGTGTITAGVGRVIVRNTGTGDAIAADATTGSVFAILGNDITAGGQALRLSTTGGTADMLRAFVDNNRFERTTAGPAVSFNGQSISALANSIAVRSFGSNTVTGNGTGGGILFDNVRFDADGAGTAVNATALTVGTTGARVEGNGVTFLNTIGIFNAGTLNIANNNGTGLLVDTKGAGTTFTLNNTGGAVDTTNGTAINLDPLTVGMTLDSVTATGGLGVTNGIIFDDVAGSFTVTGATTITDTTDYGIHATLGNTGTFNFNAVSIDNTGSSGGGVRIDSGTLAVFGTTSIQTADGYGLVQTGGAMSIDGALSISTGTGQGVAASAGTITATNVANTVASTGGAAVAMLNNTANLFFASTSSSASSQFNIVLQNVAGTIDLGTGTLAGANNTAVRVIGGTAVISYAGAINSTVGQAVEISGRTVASGAITLSGNINHNSAADRGIYVHDNTGGTVTFSGASQSITTGSANGVELSTNTGATTNFTGGALAIGSTTGTGFVASGGGTVNVSGTGNTITASAGGAVLATGIGGTMTFASIASTGSPTDGVNLGLNSGASFTVTGNTIISSPTESGVEIAGAGTISFLGTGSSITGAGAAPFLVTGGTANVTWNGAVTQGAGAAMVSITNHATGTITFNTGTLSATAGTGLQFSNADGTYNFNGTTTLNGGDAGIDIIGGSEGRFTFGTGTAITHGAVGPAFFLDSSNANITYSGGITDNNGYAVAINNHDGGTITFQTGTISSTGLGAGGIIVQNSNGGIVNFNGQTTLSTGNTTAVDLNSNTGGTVNFDSTGAESGSLNITTSDGIGFNATGGGTVTVRGTGNVISSVTGTALNVVNTTIGAAGLTFQSISSNGAGSGIVLTNTGTLGGLTVTGTGTANSGGTIQNSTGNAITASGTRNLNLTSIRILNSVGEGINATNLGGTNSVTDSAISGFDSGGTATRNAISIVNSNTDMTSFTVSGTTITGSGTSNDGVFMEAQGTSNMALIVEGASTFTNMFGDGVQVNGSTGATGNVRVTVRNSNFTNAAALGNGGISLQSFGAVNYFADIDTNTFDTIMRPVSNLGAVTATNGQTANANITVRNNTINNLPGTRGISFTADGSGQSQLLIDNNDIDRLGSNHSGINVNLINGNGQVTVSNNRIGQQAPLWANGPYLNYAIRLQTQNASSMTSLVSGNFATAGVTLDGSVLYVEASGTSTLNSIIRNNTLQDTSLDFGLGNYGIGAFTTGTATVNVDIDQNNLLGTGVIDLFEAAAGSSLNVEQAQAALAANNNAASVSVTGSPQFLTGNPPLPTTPALP